jgi:hypothetical protein
MTGVRNLVVALSLAMQTQMLTENELLQDIVKLRRELVNWLSPSDPSINFNTADRARHQGTAEWFTQSSVFKNWKESSSFLWIHGKRTSPSPICALSFANRSPCLQRALENLFSRTYSLIFLV